MTEELADAITVWCTSYPRRVTAHQKWAESPLEVGRYIKEVEGTSVAPYVSVYSFPHGHTVDGCVPSIDTIFIDFDIPAGGEYRSSNPDPQAWYRDMSALLTRVRSVCRLLVKEGSDKHFRAALSGHKGVHLYLDFPAIDPNEGTAAQFKNGMRRYADELIDFLEAQTYLDLEEWVDVDSSDLARLCRLPNTKHVGASKAFDEDRYCVPVSVRELANITPNEYAKLTRSPRPVPADCRRVPNEKAGDVITQYVREATGANYCGISSFDPEALERYKEEQNKEITLEDIPFLTREKPCIWAFRERPDMFSHGAASHAMELNVIANLVNQRVPIDVIVEFFSEADEFDEDFTRHQVEKVIAHKLNPYRCDTIWAQAPMFCLGESCNLYHEYKGTATAH
ncbi:hypothetical protein ACFQGT_09870 [Natrialbaceae archaeon GCM10025810]|uniref:hypothetical protein n=1 Tax=Halovalidus salilacus TaxID=3075124 RepID=UPI003617023C